MLFPLIQLFVAIALVWLGSGLILSAASTLANSLKISPFILSFFVLGVLTSVPESMIAATAVARSEPELMVGNLLGGSLVLFLLVIPLLAIVSRRIRLPSTLARHELIFALGVVIAPAILILDRQLSLSDAVLMILLYLFLFWVMFRRQALVERLVQLTHSRTSHTGILLAKIIIGLILVYLGSQTIVSVAEFFAQLLQWNKFIVGLLIVAIGTNIPELSLVIRTAVTKKTNIALADYIGSASVNTLIMGIFTLVNGQPILLPNHSLQRIILLATGLVLFYFFARSKRELSRNEGFVLISIYLLFVWLETSIS